jgi:hypothetical protein
MPSPAISWQTLSGGAPAITDAPVAAPEVISTGRKNLEVEPDVAGSLRNAQITSGEPVWRALLDISVWRGRWWWRLAASLRVFRP